MTGRMSLDHSAILIEFGNLSRPFELSSCAILNSVSVVATSLAARALLRLFSSWALPSPRGAKLTLRHSAVHVGMSGYP